MEQAVRDKIEEYVKKCLQRGPQPHGTSHVQEKLADSRERLAATGNLVSTAWTIQ